MLLYELEEQEALKQFADKEVHSSELVREFFEDHFVAPNPQCEYVSNVLSNLIAITGEYYLSLSKDKRLSFLKCILSVLKMALAMKLWELRLSAEDAVQQLSGKYLFFGSMTELIEPLESLQKGLHEIDPALALRRVLLVEGETEASFIREIQLRATVSNFEFTIYVYRGKGEVNNLLHYVRERNRQGIRVDLCYDRDGQDQTTAFVNKLREAPSFINDLFGFRRDFEAAFPPDVLHTALVRYLKEFANLPESQMPTLTTVESLLRGSKPFIFAFTEQFSVNINKPKFGILLAESVLANKAIWDDVFKTSVESNEIVRFLRFVMLW